MTELPIDGIYWRYHRLALNHWDKSWKTPTLPDYMEGYESAYTVELLLVVSKQVTIDQISISGSHSHMLNLILYTLYLNNYAYWLHFVVFWWWSILSLWFMITSLALGQSYDCPSASEVIMKNMTIYITCTHKQLITYITIAKQNTTKPYVYLI